MVTWDELTEKQKVEVSLAPRLRLADRRAADVIEFVHRLPGGSAQPMTATIGRFPDGGIAEIFIDPPKLSNDAANLARDVAVLISIALQRGATIAEMRGAVGRAEDGTPHSIAGSALDLLAAEG